MTDGKRVSYEEYLKKYCDCEGNVCMIKPKDNARSTSEAEKPKLITVPLRSRQNFVGADLVDFHLFKKRLTDLENNLARCGNPKMFYSDSKTVPNEGRCNRIMRKNNKLRKLKETEDCPYRTEAQNI